MKVMTNNLTTLAALPMAGGCLSALPAEVGKPPKPKPTAQMKAPYFEEHDEMVFPPIDLGEIGGDGA